MKDKIGIGFIGTGFAQLTQMPAFRDCEGAELVSVSSGHIENARAAAKEFRIPHVAEDWRETVEHEDVDLVCITTPPDLHHEMVLFTIERGKHILCEKPMAMNAEESKEMAEAAGKAGILALIDHELRFLNGRKLAFDMLRNGELGTVIHAKSAFRNASRGNPDLKWNWWSDKSRGGGALGAIGSHAIDGFRWLLGTEVSDISCLLKTNIKERRDADGEIRPVTSDDECNFILRFEDSELTKDASGTGSFSMVEIGKYDFWMEIYGTEGSLIIGEKDRLEVARKGESSFTEIDTKPGMAPVGTREGGWSMGFLAFAEEIVCALKEGRTEIERAATFRDGHEVQKVLDAARRSDESGCREKVG
ncbi:MAG: Gfo/Idh/MocA family oxidoreductase [Aridibacter famidurans]|nr:Gfo/Idh/MocA family oxidoreductase [Aridibacter famidurans]